ncbi:DNA adenine methylase [Azospirillum thermophilum]|uniref:site-specific DNA-methyltransferase (adenine-specific) n=1 Tax=Azospirillum thermophilum TaxID=2202148 RepID=A0A2S2D0N4_9PROT|nr:DNA adenine methylase [Azospirillum thermophilum]AWK90312.1 DNA methyltransferase [Azospirillum thermophilum]
MEVTTRAVRPVSPVAGYIGGKRNLARRLVPLLSSIPHRCYAEPFVGMGGIFLRRDQAPPAEVINDWSTDVATLFRILQRHYEAFMGELKYKLTSRAEFHRLMDSDPDTLTDLERAARFLYLQRTSYGGKVAGRTFGVDPGGGARFDVTKLGAVLEAVHERLAGVVIERLPYAEFIRRYDRPDTLFYLDPPYWGCEADYGRGLFDRADFATLADLLAALQGRFVLSINDRPEVRELFSGFAMAAVPTTYTVGGGAGKTVGELVITNHPACLELLAAG